MTGDALETVTEIAAALGGWKVDAAWTNKGKAARRNLPKAVREAAPRAWPGNVMQEDTMDEERVARPKLAGKAGDED